MSGRSGRMARITVGLVAAWLLAWSGRVAAELTLIEEPVATGPGTQVTPDVSGARTIWAADGTVFLQEPGAQPKAVGLGRDPRISGSRAVWESDGRIVLLDLEHLTMGKIVLDPVATAEAQPQTPWQTNSYGVLDTRERSWHYVMGYHFTPLADGRVTQLGGRFRGAKQVVLFDRATGQRLAAATVLGTDNIWRYVDISPVSVTAKHPYTVAVYLEGSGGVYQSLREQPLPRTFGEIRIDGATYAYTRTNTDARPTNTMTSAMYGQADVRFMPDQGGATARPQRHPAISSTLTGARVVWEDYRHGNAEIYLSEYDARTGRSTTGRLTNDPADQVAPAIHGNRVVWQDGRHRLPGTVGAGDNWDIYLLDLSQTDPADPGRSAQQLTSDPTSQIRPAISGTRVVWEDHRNNTNANLDIANGNADIFLLDLADPTRGAVDLTPSTHPQWNPTISGSLVAYEDGRKYSPAAPDRDIYLMDVADALRSPNDPESAARQIVRNPDAETADQSDPALQGQRVVWVDARRGTADIYGATILGVDTVPPTVAITTPTVGTHVHGRVEVRAQATDDVGVARVTFRVDDAGVPFAVDTSVPYSTIWDTRILTNGEHVLGALAYDAAGNFAQHAFTVVVDNAPPTVTLTTPGQGATVSGTAVPLAAEATDNLGVRLVTFYRVAPNGLVSLGMDDDVPFTLAWDSTTVPDGSVTLHVEARDQAGNVTRSVARTITVRNAAADTTPPTVAFRSPSPNAFLRGLAGLSVAAEDEGGIDRVEFFRDSNVNLAVDTDAPYGAEWDTRTTADGVHALWAVALDTAGNRATAQVSVVVDNTAPTVTVTAPDAGTVVSGRAVTLMATASDNIEVQVVTFYRVTPNGLFRLGSDDDAPYTMTWDSTTVPDGSVTLHAEAMDRAGNTMRSVARTLRVRNQAADVTPPVVTIRAPGDGTTVASAGFAFRGIVADPSGVADIRVYVYDYGRGTYTVRNLSVPYVPSLDGWSVEVTGSQITAGQDARLWVRAEDGAGNVSTWQSVLVHVAAAANDSEGPVVTIATPERNSTVSSQGVVMRGTAGDPSGIASVRVYVYDYGRAAYTVSNASASYNATQSTWVFDVPGSALTPGQLALLWVQATDQIGNRSAWHTVGVLVASTP